LDVFVVPDDVLVEKGKVWRYDGGVGAAVCLGVQ